MKVSFYLLGAFLLFVACSGTSGALPQASIPAPTGCSGDDCITVSSPDSDGRMTITGNAGAVADSSIVIISATAASTSFLDKVTGLFCGTANAQAACTSDLPVCSDVEGALTDSCQLTAESDGSFLVRLIIDTGRTLRISYLNPDTCEEIEKLNEILSELITTGLYDIPLEGVAMVDNNISNIYIFGTADGVNRLLSVDVSADTPDFNTFQNTIFIDGTPTGLAYFETGGASFLTYMTDAETGIAPVGNSDVTQIVEAESQTDTPQTLLSKNAFFQADFDYGQFTGINSCMRNGNYNGITNRIFFMRALTDAEIVRNGTGLGIPLSILDQTASETNAGIVTYDFRGFVPDLAEATFISVDGSVETSAGRLFFLGRFRKADSTETHYLFEIPINDHMCEGSISPVYTYANELVPFEVPGLGMPGKISNVVFEGAGESREFLMIPDIENGTVAMIDLEARSNRASTLLTFLGDDSLDGVTTLLPYSGGASPVIIGVGSRPQVIQFGVDASAGGANPAVAQTEDATVAGIHPVDATVLGSQLIVLGSGLADDSLGSVRLIDLE